MLLTNTQNTLTNNITTGNGLVIACGVEFGGCACRPANFADRLSDKRAAAKRISERMRSAVRVMHVMYVSHQSTWQQPWIDSPTLHSSNSTLLLGCGNGSSLS